MTAGTHGSTFGGNPLAMSAANATLDIMLAPGFFEHVQQIALLLKQRLAGTQRPLSRRDRRSARRRAADRPAGGWFRPANWSMRLRAEKMLTVGAGDNVVRLLPPLIISEAGNRRRRRAARPRLRAAEPRPCQKPKAGGGRMSARPPFPRSHRRSGRRSARDDRGRARHEGRSKRDAGRRSSARRQDAGDDFRAAVDAHPRLVRSRHAPARRRCHSADRGGDAARPRRDARRHRARAVALCRRHHDPHARSPRRSPISRATPRCRSSTA